MAIVNAEYAIATTITLIVIGGCYCQFIDPPLKRHTAS